MTPPQSNTAGSKTLSGSKTLVAYAIGYVIAIASIVSDIRLGGVHFTLLGFASSIVLSALVIYRMARAMAAGPTPARAQPAAEDLPAGQQLAVA